MKFRTFFSFVLGGMAMTAFAQGGGYQDGVDYYNAERFEKAKTILEKTTSVHSNLTTTTHLQPPTSSTKVCRQIPPMVITM